MRFTYLVFVPLVGSAVGLTLSHFASHSKRLVETELFSAIL